MISILTPIQVPQAEYNADKPRQVDTCYFYCLSVALNYYLHLLACLTLRSCSHIIVDMYGNMCIGYLIVISVLQRRVRDHICMGCCILYYTYTINKSLLGPQEQRKFPLFLLRLASR